MYNSLKRLSDTMQSSKALPRMAPNFLENDDKFFLTRSDQDIIETKERYECRPVQRCDFAVETFIILEKPVVVWVQAIIRP